MNYNQYIKKETSTVKLFYDRGRMRYGEVIKGYDIDEYLLQGLLEADAIVFSMYWKPLGDSFLFLSIIQAVDEFLKITRANNMPVYLLDGAFSNLMRHIDILQEAKVIDNGISYFKQKHLFGEKIALITDDDPIVLNGKPTIFNSENYIYPKFTDLNGNKAFSSRPARYFLTFEREIGIKLKSEPDLSLPSFSMHFDQVLEEKIFDTYKILLKDRFVAIISQAGEIEKRYGTLNFLKVFSKLKETYNDLKCILISTWKEESPKEWYQVKSILEKDRSIVLLDTKDFEILAYIFSRCFFILGNDTGFSHLAAMSLNPEKNSLPKTFILYSRHDYKKWSTGKDNVIPIATRLAKFLAKNNMSLRRDSITENLKGKDEWAFSIRSSTIINTVIRNINAS